MVVAQPERLPTHEAYPPPSSSADVNKIANTFISSLSEAAKQAEAGDGSAFGHLLIPSGYWRDVLAFTRDYRNFTTSQTTTAAAATFPSSGAKDFTVSTSVPPALETPFPDVTWILVTFDFDTTLGTCSGNARLVHIGNDEWKAYTIYTLLEEIHGHPQLIGKNRPYGRHNDKETYDQKRARELEFSDKDPEVLILGAGHNGLATAAVLRSFGVTSLCVDKFERIGDNWRKRYASLSLHDPVHTDHMPLMNFPQTWPTFMSAGKLANWLETYAEAMEVNVWMKSTLDPSRTKWNDGMKKWEVVVLRTLPDGSVQERPFTVSHIVLATGLVGGKAKMPPPFTGQQEWKGTIVHSSGHKGGAAWTGKRALVVGACTSAHDISVDLVNNGVHTTMLQRSPTFIMSIDKGLPLLDGGLFTEEGLAAQTVETCDRITDSMPKQVGKFFHQRVVQYLANEDKEILDGLKKAGFKTWPGPDGTGWLFLALEKAGGYYFTADAGGSQMIADGKIKIQQGEIASFDNDSYVTFNDGNKQQYDLVIFATGYSGFRDTVAETLGPVYTDQIKQVWGLDKDMEVNGVARDMGLPHVYTIIGNFMMARWYSRRIALQVIAENDGKWAAPYTA